MNYPDRPVHSLFKNEPIAGNGISPWRTIFRLLAIVGVLIIAAVAIHTFRIAQQVARITIDSNNLKRLALAVHNYEAVYKRLPAAVYYNVYGDPVWSWAATTVSFAKEDLTTYQMSNPDFYSFDMVAMNPWNAAGNEALQGPAPEFLISKRASTTPGESNVFVLAGPVVRPADNFGKPEDSGYKSSPAFMIGAFSEFSEVTDGISDTIFSIMFTKHSAPWASPSTAITIDEAFDYFQQEESGCLVGFLDGQVKWLDKATIDLPTFRALATCRGGEKVTRKIASTKN